MKLALGPLLYYWKPERIRAFYRAAAGWPVETVYLGETICGLRRKLVLQDWLDIADSLVAMGKEVVLSVPTLRDEETSPRELEEAVRNGRFSVEANDMATVRLANEAGVPYVIGSQLDTSDPSSLDLLVRLGAVRWLIPAGIVGEALPERLAHLPGDLQTEVFGYGRMPLAFSSRCYAAHARGLSRTNCRLACADYPEGLMLRAHDGAPWLVANGPQTQSACVCNLLESLGRFVRAGIDVVRLSPQHEDMGAVAEAFAGVIAGRLSPKLAKGMLSAVMREDYCDEAGYGRRVRDWSRAATALVDAI